MNASTPASSSAAANVDWRSRNSSRVMGGTSRRETWVWREDQAHVSSDLEGRGGVAMEDLRNVDRRTR